MGSKVHVNQDFLDDFDDNNLTQETTSIKRKKRDYSRRRDIDNIIENRRLKSQIRDSYDELYLS